ncbi:hypothetical protein AB0B45_22060 [Nonomuraea sp. NPDC049152]|uniref:hypothetical protein n=1 Tax=Nonomuraea sp. NPDC049152 TaxID=3154350 RepID=UPI00340EE4EF
MVSPQAADLPLRATFSRAAGVVRVNRVTEGGSWMADRADYDAFVAAPNTSRRVRIIAFCDGDIAARFTLDARVNGRLTMLGRLCGRVPNPDRGGYGTLGSERLRGKTVTISVRVKTDIPEFLRRPGTLTLAVYQG